MTAADMKFGHTYRLLKDGKIVVLGYISDTGSIIVHPPGEPDMQSSFVVTPNEECEEVS
jgi:hypothetical protein